MGESSRLSDRNHLLFSPALSIIKLEHTGTGAGHLLAVGRISNSIYIVDSAQQAIAGQRKTSVPDPLSAGDGWILAQTATEFTPLQLFIGGIAQYIQNTPRGDRHLGRRTVGIRNRQYLIVR
ncbi:MAG: hypothetical protein BWY75_01062 [bacterium ADurb.Bin425]|nr:MAG: hypothetical protein BWY75_01062 [bacterium ADurb.Bin425]